MPPMPKGFPNQPIGSVHNSSGTEPFGLKVGQITRVDALMMKADIKIITGGGERFEIDLTQGMAGPRSFWGGIPEKDSLVILGYRKKHMQIYEAMILGYIPVGSKAGLRFDPFSPTSPAEVTAEDAAAVRSAIGGITRMKRLLLRSGDVGGMSSRGAELALTQDVRVCNRAGDALELRDSDRTLVMQAIHRVESLGGSRRFTGPIRRGEFWLPQDILQADGRTLRTSADHYYGRDELQASGPPDTRFADSNGKILDTINNVTESPPVTYSNGRRTYYPSTSRTGALESLEAAGADAYVEDRIELSHTSDLTLDVLGEIDGVAVDRKDPYIEHVMGTVVGNMTMSSEGQRQYGRILMPSLFEDFLQTGPASFRMSEISRVPTEPDLEVDTMAGAYLFRIRSPRAYDKNFFNVSVSKQGKLFVNLPGSSVERGRTKNISAEVQMAGALKMRLGAAQPGNVSANITGAGGMVLNLGIDSEGNSLTINHTGAIKFKHTGSAAANDDDVAISEEVDGNKESTISGEHNSIVNGSKKTTVGGQCLISAARLTLIADGGYTLNTGEINTTVVGKSQYNYALAVLENILAGGKISTIVAGGQVDTVFAGAVAKTVLGGAMTTTVAAGGYAVVVGAGAIAIGTAAGAIAIAAGAGAISIAAGAGIAISGLAVIVNAATTFAVNSPMVCLGSIAAPLGVSRGLPGLPPGVPSFCWITGLPVMGSALVRSM